MEKIPVANTFIGEEEAKAAYDTIKSGCISRGKKVDEFEAEFSKYTGARHSISTNNGTSALHVALAALDIKKGDEVIVPSMTFISSANVVIYQNAKPVLVECDPRTLNTTPEIIEKAITKKTKAIMPVDVCGMPCDYDGIMKVANEHKIPVVWDSAESIGATYKGRKIGSIAPIQIFSFFPNKNMTTGEGGMITCEDEELAKKMRILVNQGQEGRYNHTHLGYNYRLTNFQGAIGSVQLKRVDWVVKEKEKLARRYAEAFRNDKDIKAPYLPPYVTQHSWFMYTIIVDPKKRDRIVQGLDAENIETRITFPPIHSQPYYIKTFSYTKDYLPITYKTYQSVISIPIWAELGIERQDRVISTLKKICKSLK